MSTVTPASLQLPSRQLLVAVTAVAVALATMVTVSQVDDATAGAQASPDCVTASNGEHVDAGRATQLFFFVRAVGSGDFLGFSFSTTSLQQEGPGSWTEVESCSTPPTTAPPTTGPTTTTPPDDRQPLEPRYTGMYETDSGLPGHTVYRPDDLSAVTDPMPIVVWGNGACSANGTWFQEFLTPLAAHGVLVVASGTPGGSGSTTSDMLIDAIDWAIAENGRPGSKYYGQLDTDAVTAMGQSCGGIEAIDASSDPRVASTVLWNSGIFPSGGIGGVDKSALEELHAPVAWLTGGPSDIAYENAVDDYDQVPGSVPSVLGHYDDVGHTAMFTDPEIEQEIVGVAADWLDATLFDDEAARSEFVGPACGLCFGTEWDMQSKNWD